MFLLSFGVDAVDYPLANCFAPYFENLCVETGRKRFPKAINDELFVEFLEIDTEFVARDTGFFPRREWPVGVLARK